MKTRFFGRHGDLRMTVGGRSSNKRSFFSALVFSIFIYLFSAPFLFAEVGREGNVSRVIDGDTFQLSTGEKVRLIGVDTPEYQPWNRNVQYYGREASLFSKALLAHQTVLLQEDIEKKDKYGRTLAYVYLKNGDFVNLILVEQGLARVKYYPPNGLHYKELKASEKIAKKLQKGMWKVKI